MKKKIVILNDYEQVFTYSPAIQELKKDFNVVIYTDKESDEDILAQRLENAEIIIPIRERTRFTMSLLERLLNLQLIVQTGTGLAHIDLDTASEKGIKVCNMPGISTASVTELTLGMMLSCLRRFPEHMEVMRSGRWEQPYGRELKGKVTGIIGFGPIGRSVARVLQAFEANVIAWSPSLTQEKAQIYGVDYATLDQLLQQSDIVSIHLRAVSKFNHLLNRDRLMSMKKGSILINTSRASLVDMESAVDLLQSGHLGSAGFDVFETEPLPTNDKIRYLPNVTLTAHIGWVTEELLNQFAVEAAQNIKRYATGQPLNFMNQHW